MTDTGPGIGRCIECGGIALLSEACRAKGAIRHTRCCPECQRFVPQPGVGPVAAAALRRRPDHTSGEWEDDR